MAKKLVYDTVELRKVCIEAGSMMEAARRLKLHFNTFKKLATAAGCYHPNTARGGGKSKHKLTKEDVVNKYLSNRQYVKLSRLRKHLISFGFKEAKCEVCGLSEWQGRAIPLELHHRDGDHYNNALDNLEILCPTCHAQKTNGSNQPTKKKYAESLDVHTDEIVTASQSLGVIAAADTNNQKRCLYCLFCWKPIYVPSSEASRRHYCSRECFNAARMHVNISADDLLSLLSTATDYAAVGTALGMSADRIKYLCSKLGIREKANKLLKENKQQLKDKDVALSVHKCLVCGNEFTVRGSGVAAVNRKYCSCACAQRAVRRFDTTKEELLALFSETPNYTKIAASFGISGGALKKGCKRLGIFEQVDALIQAEKRRRGFGAITNLHTNEYRKLGVKSRLANLPDFVAYVIDDLQPREVLRFHTQRELEDAGFNYTVVCRVCRGARKTYKGFVWRREQKVKK